MPVLTIYPYLLGQTWVFDDPRTGLKEEAFVLGMAEMISRLVKAKAIPHAGQHPFARHVESSNLVVIHVCSLPRASLRSPTAFRLATVHDD